MALEDTLKLPWQVQVRRWVIALYRSRQTGDKRLPGTYPMVVDTLRQTGDKRHPFGEMAFLRWAIALHKDFPAIWDKSPLDSEISRVIEEAKAYALSKGKP